MTSLVFFHGFLGSSEDWLDCIAYLPQYRCVPLSYPFQVPELGLTVVVGYSMGGRIAYRYPYPRILISTHPGLQTEEERKNRWALDNHWIQRLSELPFEKWLLEWYAQPLFDSLRNHPRFHEILERRKKLNPEEVGALLFKESLAHDLGITDMSYTVFIYGMLDTKFEKLYRERHIEAIGIENVGHACMLEDPKGCAKVIESTLNLILNKYKGSSL